MRSQITRYDSIFLSFNIKLQIQPTLSLAIKYQNRPMGRTPNAKPNAAFLGVALNWSHWVAFMDINRWMAGSNWNEERKAQDQLDFGINTLRPKQNGRRFADDTFILIFVNENVRISIKISLKFVPKGPINNIPALVQIMAWRRSSDKPLSEPMMVSLLTHMCITRPQWVEERHLSSWGDFLTNICFVLFLLKTVH